jgi:hypothetical protein
MLIRRTVFFMSAGLGTGAVLFTGTVAFGSTVLFGSTVPSRGTVLSRGTALLSRSGLSRDAVLGGPGEHALDLCSSTLKHSF